MKIGTLRWRTLRNMTQMQLAKKAHLSKTTISNLESGRQTKIELETIAKLCQALNCTPNDLFELSEESKELEAQKKALEPFIGTLEYDVTFKPEKLDQDLAKIIQAKKRKS